MRTLTCDVAVIGSGGAGLMAAASAAESGAKVIVLNKGWTAHTGSTVMAPGAFAAVGEPWCSSGDSVGLHFDDTLRSGKGLNNTALTEAVVRNASDAVLSLERMGALFDRDGDTGNIKLLRPDEGHSKNRAVSFQRRIGQEILNTLRAYSLRIGVCMEDNHQVYCLLRSDTGAVCGVFAFNSFTSEPLVVRSKSVIIATGGAGNLYLNSDAPLDLSGDGMYFALDAGAELTDMEFIQFHPAGLVSPPSMRGLLGAHMSVVHLYNTEGVRFMGDYDPDNMERATRDILSRAMMTEILSGRGTPLGGVYGSLKHNSMEQLKRLIPEYCRLYRRMGFDPKTELLELAPSAHYTIGGIRVGNNWATKVPGLFAAGEVCGGVHGANRLSQNALTEMLVSGSIAGRSAAGYSLSCGENDGDNARRIAEEFAKTLSANCAGDGISPYKWRERLKRIMTEKVGVIRSEQSLKEALDELDVLESVPIRISDYGTNANGELIQTIENRHMLTLARCVTGSALLRKETRGAHARIDYPIQNDDYICNFVVSMERDGIKIRRCEVE